jgi:AcrR family transcriptional regulator
MGRPKEFSVDEALDIATGLFWRMGYEATSIAELTKAMGISPPSFYAEFLSKEGLFERVLERYSKAQGQVIETAFSKIEPIEIIRTLMRGGATLFTNPRYAPGCLIMNSALPVTGGVPFRERFANQREQLRIRLRDRLMAVSSASVHSSPELDASTIARLTLSIYWGMAVEAQSGASRKELLAIGYAFVKLLEKGFKLDAAKAQ